jgi:hypothetical protein
MNVDIRNAVLKAALVAAAEPGPDSANRIYQHHFEASIQEVIAGKRVMRQSLFACEPPVLPEANLVAGATAFHASPLVAYALAGPRCSWRSSRSQWPWSSKFTSS